MGEKEKIEEMFREELRKNMQRDRMIEFPVTVQVGKDDLPDLERWREHE